MYTEKKKRNAHCTNFSKYKLHFYYYHHVKRVF